MPEAIAIPALVGVAALEWVAGMATFKRTLRWCDVCGRRLTCACCSRVSDYRTSQVRT
jgi:hypothetical protein